MPLVSVPPVHTPIATPFVGVFKTVSLVQALIPQPFPGVVKIKLDIAEEYYLFLQILAYFMLAYIMRRWAVLFLQRSAMPFLHIMTYVENLKHHEGSTESHITNHISKDVICDWVVVLLQAWVSTLP